jgi:ring-1,2-phenylacetyl-CoA epoxidase subunit PaaE
VPEHLQDAYRFVPGQHLGIRAHVAGQELRRTYSICSGIGEKLLRIGVRVHDQGSMSRHLARNVQVGDLLEVLTPTGRFFAQPDATVARTYCAFASGSGITPILGIFRNVLAREPHSRCLLFYGNRTTASIMFAEELLALKDCHLQRFALYFLLSREPQDVELFNGRLDRAKVALLGKSLFEPGAVDAFYLCGPGSMLEDVRAELLSLGVDAARIHAEHYTTEAASASGGESTAGASSSELSAAAGMTQVSVVMDGRQRSFTMPGTGTTVLEAAEAEGLDLPYSCRAGVCSTCRTKVTRGRVTMKENYALEPWEVEQGYVLCCQALPASAELELTYDER